MKKLILTGLLFLGLVQFASANNTIRNWLWFVPYISSEFRLYTSTNNYLWEDSSGTLNYSSDVNFSSGTATYGTINCDSLNATYGVSAATGVFSGDITISGNVDGRDISVDGTTLDNVVISTGNLQVELDSLESGVATDTTTLRTDLNAVIVSTGVLQLELDALESGVAIDTTTLQSNITTLDSEVLKKDGSVELTSDWDAGSGSILTNYGINAATGVFSGDITANKIVTTRMNAKDSSGLYLVDDGDHGIHIRDGGNVGIGTTNPAYALDIYKTSGPQFRFIGDSGATNMEVFAYSHNQNFRLTTEASDREAVIKFGNENGGSTEGWALLGTGANKNKRLDIASAVTISQNNNSEGSTVMTILQDGNVGIGTTSPSSKLEVNGEIKTDVGYVVASSSQSSKMVFGTAFFSSTMSQGTNELTVSFSPAMSSTSYIVLANANEKGDGTFGSGELITKECSAYTTSSFKVRVESDYEGTIDCYVNYIIIGIDS